MISQNHVGLWIGLRRPICVFQGNDVLGGSSIEGVSITLLIILSYKIIDQIQSNFRVLLKYF